MVTFFCALALVALLAGLVITILGKGFNVAKDKVVTPILEQRSTEWSTVIENDLMQIDKKYRKNGYYLIDAFMFLYKKYDVLFLLPGRPELNTVESIVAYVRNVRPHEFSYFIDKDEPTMKTMLYGFAPRPRYGTAPHLFAKVFYNIDGSKSEKQYKTHLYPNRELKAWGYIYTTSLNVPQYVVPENRRNTSIEDDIEFCKKQHSYNVLEDGNLKTYRDDNSPMLILEKWKNELVQKLSKTSGAR